MALHTNQSDHADEHYSRGVSLERLSRFEEAIASYEAAIRIRPDHADAHYNLGNSFAELGRFEEAIASYEAAIRIRSDHADAHYNRGNSLVRLGRFEEAIASYEAAIRISPDHAEAYCNLGFSLRRLGKFDEAIASYEAAIRIRPDHADAHYNRGNSLAQLDRFDEALASYEVAIRIRPDHAGAYCNLGVSLRRLRRFDEAIAAYDAAIRIRPDHADAHYHRGNSLAELGRLDEAIVSYEATIRIKPDHVNAHSSLIYGQYYRSGINKDIIPTVTRRFAALFEPVFPTFIKNFDLDRKLRIGYVSGDFGRHSVSFFLAPVLENHDHKAFEVYCYETNTRNDEINARLRSFADHWRSLVGLTDQAGATLVRSDAIDILVDLSGHTANGRLPIFAHKPAPVQVTWLGFPGTTGLSTIDYRLVDEISDPEDAANEWHSETLYRLEHGFLCFAPPSEAPDVAPPTCPDSAITFGSFNNPLKLSTETLDTWAALLVRLPEARLLLKGKSFSNESARTLLLERLRLCGVTADRVTLLDWASEQEKHLRLYGQIDIALDPFPYNGTTTTCEALWMGIPVVTLQGTRHSGRVGASLLTQLGLQDLIAADAEAYVSIAANLAADRQRLGELRQSLRSRMAVSPLCNGPAFTRDLEAAFRTMWRNWCKGN